MSDSSKEDASVSGDTAPEAAAVPEPARARPPSKTMLGMGVPKPPPASGTKPTVPLPPPAITATFAKPVAHPAGPVPPAPPSAAAPRTSSLFDLDAPGIGSAQQKPAAPPVASKSLFDLDAPNTGRFDVSTLRKPPVPEAAQPQAPPAMSAPPRDPADAQPDAPAAYAPAATTQSTDHVAALFQPATSSFDPPLSLAPAGVPEDAESSSGVFDEVSSLDEISAFDGNTARIAATIFRQASSPEQERELQAPQPSAASAPPEESLDASIDLSRGIDTLETRRSRLASRYKAARTAVKVLGLLDPTEEERKEVLAIFTEYDARLKVLASGAPEVGKKDSSALHRELEKDGVDELERALTRAEERLLALDEYATQAKFYARITKDKHPPKLLLRYARFLASRRFNVGYRRDRFEYLVTELLTVRTSDGRMRLLPREKARPVLQQILTGAALDGQQSDREVAVAYLRESLERLSKITTHEEFFESGFFLDVHGYKVSMRDQSTSSEFLYLSVALNVEIHNSMEAWITGVERLLKANLLTQDGRPRDYLHAQLRAQEEAVQGVFGGFRHPKERASQQTVVRAAVTGPVKEVKKIKKAARKQQTTGSADLAELARTQLTKLAVVTALILASFMVVIFQTGTVSVGEPDLIAFTETELHQLSPLLITGILDNGSKKLEGELSRPLWNKLSRNERDAAAQKLLQNLKARGVQNADIYAYKDLAIRVELGVVSLVN